MALIPRNSLQLIDPDKLKLKILLVALPGFGKTTFIANCPNPGLGVSETGHGKGLLSVAAKGIDFVEINSYEDFDAFCSGEAFKDKETLGYDSLSDSARTFIKDKALKIPRKQGDSAKRLAGVPELDDYGVIAELTRKLTKKLIDQPKHIVVSAGLRVDKADPENGHPDTLIGPDFPGQMFLGSSAMFDIVLLGRNRSRLIDPKDARSRINERYWMTEGSGGYIAKNRLCVAEAGSFLPPELVFNLEKNTGTFDDIFRRAQEAYRQFLTVPK